MSLLPGQLACFQSHAAALLPDSLYILRQHLTPDGKGGQRASYYRIGATEQKQRVSISGATAGTFTLNGISIPYNATRFQLWDLLKAVFADVPRYGPSIRTEGGPLPGTPIDVIHTGSRSGLAVDLMAVNSSGLTGGTASVEITTSFVAATTSPCRIDPAGAGFERSIAEALKSISSHSIATAPDLAVLGSDRLEMSDGLRVFEIKNVAKGGEWTIEQAIACDEIK
jgi:hypothetical protein